MTDDELRDVIDRLLTEIPTGDYAIVADTLSPKWIIGDVFCGDWRFALCHRSRSSFVVVVR